MVKRAFTGSKLIFAEGAVNDLRDYKVSFSKFKDSFPSFEFHWIVNKGISELKEIYNENVLSIDEFEGHKYSRVAHIRKSVKDGLISDQLRVLKKVSDPIY